MEVRTDSKNSVPVTSPSDTIETFQAQTQSRVEQWRQQLQDDPDRFADIEQEIDQDRIMAVICHNTDLGDGWEEEGVDEWYFHEFSEKKAYPLGINIVFYAMTH